MSRAISSIRTPAAPAACSCTSGRFCASICEDEAGRLRAGPLSLYLKGPRVKLEIGLPRARSSTTSGTPPPPRTPSRDGPHHEGPFAVLIFKKTPDASRLAGRKSRFLHLARANAPSRAEVLPKRHPPWMGALAPHRRVESCLALVPLCYF